MENTFLMEMESEYANTLTLRLCKEKDELMALIKKMEKFLS